MRWMRGGRGERGAMTVIVAIVVPVLLLGLGAIIVDVGGWYAGRAQDQNGADSAAIAIANSCARATCDTTKGAPYVSGDANGGLAHQYQACGVSSSGGLTSCAGSGIPEDGHACPPAPASGNYVDVMVKPGGSGKMPSLLGYGDQSVAACAQARWGNSVISGNILALTIAECAWNTATSSGANYAPAPPALPAASVEQYLVVHNPDDPTDPSCVSGPSVGPLPGGFGWTTPDPLSGPCTTAFIANSGGWYSNDPGQGTSTGTQCLDGGNSPGVIPCAQNPVVPNPPYPVNPLNGCPNPATPSPLIVPVYDNVCVQTGSTSVSQDEIQSVVVPASATGGSFTLTFSSPSGVVATTASIARNANVAAVQSALTALPNIGSGNVTVTSPSAGTFNVEFTGTLGFRDVALMTATSSLTGPGNPRVSVTTVQAGQYVGNACPAGFANGKYYHLATLAAFVVTGYHGNAFPHDQNSWLTGRNYCVSAHGTDPPCLMGYFVKATTSGGDIGTGPDTGVTVVKLSG